MGNGVEGRDSAWLPGPAIALRSGRWRPPEFQGHCPASAAGSISGPPFRYESARHGNRPTVVRNDNRFHRPCTMSSRPGSGAKLAQLVGLAQSRSRVPGKRRNVGALTCAIAHGTVLRKRKRFSFRLPSSAQLDDDPGSTIDVRHFRSRTVGVGCPSEPPSGVDRHAAGARTYDRW